MLNLHTHVISCSVESVRATKVTKARIAMIRVSVCLRLSRGAADQLPSRMMRHDSMSNVASPIASRD
jgi:hypothetical protein